MPKALITTVPFGDKIVCLAGFARLVWRSREFQSSATRLR